MDSANLIGSILIYDLDANQYFSNDFKWARKGQLPASTFKIANSIIALESGFVENDSTLFVWNGEKRRLKSWEQNLVFRDAFQLSCVPCYQELARKIGVKKMNYYLDKLNYGNMQVGANNIDSFWLEGDSRINQFQQIDFLIRLQQSELPISEHTELVIKRMMVMEDKEGFKLRGKTGWSIKNGNNNGWFVGYIERDDNTFFFATNIEPREQFEMDKFPMIRKDVTFNACQLMRIME